MVKTIFGCAGLSDQGSFRTQEERAEILNILLENNVTNLDTARLYPGSEVAIGALDKRTSFTIDTKLPGGFAPGNLSKDSVIKDVQDSLNRVGIPKFDILYLHAPDPTCSLADSLAGIHKVHQDGLFTRFGLSNFSPAQVQEVYDIAKEKGYPVPEVYQGNYNPVARHLESSLFPLLRKLNMSFYAYSPLAGGFLTKTAAELDAGAGRFNQNVIGGLYKTMYDRPALRQALVDWNKIADKEGVSKAELAYRWVAHHSALRGEEDGVIFGTSRVAQVEQTARGIQKGRLSAEAVEGIERIWDEVKHEAPLDNLNQKA
ncbi:hypothetical protein IAQ61_003368 [Plenodomus lingam]|uniref:Similar to aflatoxin B1 aldehyde reductase member 2 n=1 Tax=Leptosphaeria maculans (strain JN3 / isolate v23.1.3 / race Av1-4-5-6-7-8) TaxID=985895 RepID=E5AEA7_LEPMJ|nr:similar to aflatoxin B1 aldehyde reductase member 2 [Plenodomus lingam JN3]KAH9875903.1 hypothetical protein IAQ61_003368 [Plenodomus lingam]CBY01546.1 similar to aflatoxin B1 aldehyde reductase member 2 [Plenodomus lingam JN3]